MSDDKNNPAWYNSTLAKAAAALIFLSIGGSGTWFGKELIKKPKDGGGNLSEFVNGDYNSYKNWASGEIAKLDERLRAAEKFVTKTEAMTEARAEFEAELARIRNDHARNDRDRDFIKEYYSFQKVTIVRNRITGKVYWDDADGNRHPLSWSMCNGEKFYFYRYGAANRFISAKRCE